MIDGEGYRLNVGIVICNQLSKVFWGRRFGKGTWQFPQGGINAGESATQAMYRELFEEVGLYHKDVHILAATENWLHYNLPKRLIRWHTQPICIGQKQKWFLLKLLSNDQDINIKHDKLPEFDCWRWVNFWYPINHVVSFKKNVYQYVMNEFSKVLMVPQSKIEIN